MKTLVLFPLTARQEEIVTFMWVFYLENDQLPSKQAMCDRFGFGPSGAAAVRQVLCNKGYIEPNTLHKYRFTALFHAEQQRSTEIED